MATLVFGALGTLVGGPVGGAVGALLGRAVDRSIIGTPVREGARLTELAVSSSSYGQPIARLFGTSRAAGTIVWATDLREASETAGGGKGQPKTRQYSYSISFAVALSSRPIASVGRIWADGNLLRGEAGDLKTGGTLRVHLGHPDQSPDPLLASALGAECPAHRGLAYAVFEDLQLAEFGNRLPALSFEVFADGGGAGLIAAIAQGSGAQVTAGPVPSAEPIAGFAHDGGQVAEALELLGATLPLVADVGGSGVIVGEAGSQAAAVLPAPIAWSDGEFGKRTGALRSRSSGQAPNALRYYDSGRDYQPGLQRATGRAHPSGERLLELPATMTAAAAAELVDALGRRARADRQQLRIRIAALDPAMTPGTLVAVPGEGVWRITGWEWSSGGVELDLARAEPSSSAAVAADSGQSWRPADRLPAATRLDAFELPWDGAGSPDVERIHAAIGAGPGRWAGAALYVERAGALVPIGTAGPARALLASLVQPLAPSPALMFEPDATVEILCDTPGAEFRTVDAAALAMGANRLLVGEEIVQFMHAQPLGGGRWRLRGLLRGRGATEQEALAGHDDGTRACLLDDRLLLLDGTELDAVNERLAAIGAGDLGPVFAAVRAPGRSRRPLAPVHPVAVAQAGGGLTLEWTRRARGAWLWRDGVEVPLVEELERYVVGAGPAEAPIATWFCTTPALELSVAELAAMPAATPLWVKQIGSHALSAPLALHTLS